MSQARSPDTPRPRRTLNRERVLAGALALVDREGLDALTMRGLGQELGVEAMSLYNHIANKDAILDGLCELMLGEMVAGTAPSDDPREATKNGLRALRAVALRHPRAFPLLATRPIGAYAATRRVSERALQRFLDAGWDEPGAIRALRICVRFTLGFAMSERQPEASVPTPELLGEETPLVAGLLQQVAAEDSDELFEFGLDVVLDGLDRRRIRA